MFTPFQYASPIEFDFGAGRHAEVAQRLRERDVERVLVVTDEGIVGAGLAQRVEDSLTAAGLRIARFTDVKSNPTVGNVDAGATMLRDHRADAMVAVGGGSPIDTAKIIGASAANGCSAHAFMSGEKAITVGGVPLVAIPTTAGSGAESSRVAVLIDTETGEKKGVFGAGTAPWISVLDPELMTGMPKQLTAATGMDALSHALEAYLGLGASPFSDALAEQSMTLVARWLETVVDDGANLDARSAMTIASALGGLAKEQAGLGILHAVAMPIGYLYDLHHGYLCAALMPATLDFNQEAARPKVAWIARCFGADAGDEAEAAASAGAVIRRLNKRIGMDMRLAEAGVKTEDHDRIVADAMKSYLLRNNPVPGTEAGCREVLVNSL